MRVYDLLTEVEKESEYLRNLLCQIHHYNTENKNEVKALDSSSKTISDTFRN